MYRSGSNHTIILVVVVIVVVVVDGFFPFLEGLYWSVWLSSEAEETIIILLVFGFLLLPLSR